MAIVTAMVLGLTGTQALLAQGSFRLQELSRDADRLEREYGELVLGRAVLSSPLRIERWARGAGLELRDTDDVEVLQVRGERGTRRTSNRPSRDGTGSPASPDG